MPTLHPTATCSHTCCICSLASDSHQPCLNDMMGINYGDKLELEHRSRFAVVKTQYIIYIIIYILYIIIYIYIIYIYTQYWTMQLGARPSRPNSEQDRDSSKLWNSVPANCANSLCFPGSAVTAITWAPVCPPWNQGRVDQNKRQALD